jgi:hypothetical protein
VQQCKSCTITSQTVALSPANRARTTIGVGEEVDLTVNPSPATWSIAGGGALTPNSGSQGSVRFTADDNAGNVTITATGSGCSCSITFKVVQPSSWTMQKQDGTNLRHHEGRPDCGWKAITFFHPDDVNFYRVEDREMDSQYVGTGSYAKYNGDWHGNYPLPDRVSEWFLMNRHTANGSTDDTPDTVYTGLVPIADTGSAPPFTTGKGHFPITLQWRVVGSANVHDFPVSNQEDEIFASGRCESRKGNHTEHTMYNEAASSY